MRPESCTETRAKLSAAHVQSVDLPRAALQQDVREAAGRRSHVQARHTHRIDREGIQGRSELMAAAPDIWILSDEVDRCVARDQVARLPVTPGRVAHPHPDFAREDEGLRASARFGQPAFDEKLVEPDSLRSIGSHVGIVAQAASPRVTSLEEPWPFGGMTVPPPVTARSRRPSAGRLDRVVG